MRIVLCVKGLTRIRRWLEQKLPEDEVLDCSADEVIASASTADVLIPTVSPVGEEALARTAVKLVQQFGAGLDTVDVEAASRHGVLVANVPAADTANAESVAELAILFMLALVRRFPETQAWLRSRRLSGPIGTTLAGKTAAIVGFGGIGRALARRLRALEMRVLAVSRTGPRGADEPADFHGPAASLAEVIAAADFVVVAAPLNEETRGLIGRRELAHMKAGAFLINVARGAIVDREALFEALRERRIAGAGIDAFWQEPVDPEDPIFSFNVIATPHVGGATDVSLLGIAARIAENVHRLRGGRWPRNCVNERAVDRSALAARWRPLAPPTP